MDTTSAGKFPCEACGKCYAWKAQLAGKRVKCKCGGVMTVPKSDPAAVEEAMPPDFEDLYALAEGTPVTQALTPPAFSRGGTPCPSCGSNVETGAVVCVGCGTNLKTGKKVKTRNAGSDGGGGRPVPALATAGGGRGAMLGYAQMAPKRHGSDEQRSTDVFFHPVKDLYIPGALVVAGTMLSVVAMIYHQGVHSIGIAMFAVGVMTLINLALTVPAVLATVKMFDLGLGPIGPGVLKIAACAIAPGAFGELMGMIFTGAVGGYIGWCISLIFTIVIFMKLLEMDFGEVLICSTFIFVIRTWVVYALLFALLHGFGISGLPMGGGMGGMGGGGRITLAGEVDHDEDDSLDAMRARESDDDAIRMLHSGGVEGKTWIDGGSGRMFAGMTHGESLNVLSGLYSAGAGEVRVYPHKDAKKNEVVISMILVTPEDKDARRRVFKELKSLAKKLGRVTPRDRGEKYWPVEMLTPDEKEKQLDAELKASGQTPAPDSGDDDDDK